MKWFVYLLWEQSVTVPMCGRSGSRDTYAGMTNDVWSRVGRHNAGEVTSTRGRQWKLKAFIALPTRGTAAAVERWLKCGDTRSKRMKLAACGFDQNGNSAEAKELLEAVELWARRHPGLRFTLQETSK